MKIRHLSLLLFIFVFHVAWSQDVITKRNGDTLATKVLTISPVTVAYKLTGNTDTSVLYLPVSEIRSITYPNGIRDTFNEAESHIYKGNYYSSMCLDERGRDDAKRYYKKYRQAKTSMAFVSFFSTPYSLIPACVIASTPPKSYNLGCPYPELMNKTEYRMAYEKKAFEIKKRQTWNGFLIGTGIIVGITTVSVAAALVESYHH